jgi:hypothetical protein
MRISLRSVQKKLSCMYGKPLYEVYRSFERAGNALFNLVDLPGMAEDSE